MPLLKELQRRNVFKVAIACVVLTWLASQLADVILDLLAKVSGLKVIAHTSSFSFSGFCPTSPRDAA